MTKLKSAEALKQEWTDCKHVFFEDFIKTIQQNAIEAALNVVKDSCTILSVPNNEFEVIDKESITSLINHKDLKL